MNRYSWVVFDADGTLFDFEGGERAALGRTFRELGVTITDDDHASYRRISEELWRGLEEGTIEAADVRVRRFERLLGHLGLEEDPAFVGARYLEHLGTENRLLPGAGALLERLADHFELMLATNGFAAVQRARFGTSPVARHFRDIVISEEVGYAKPQSGYFQEVFRRMGEPPRAAVLMVGDGLSSDIAGGVGFGIDTCWYNPGARDLDGGPRPTYEISELAEILDIVGLGREASSRP